MSGFRLDRALGVVPSVEHIGHYLMVKVMKYFLEKLALEPKDDVCEDSQSPLSTNGHMYEVEALKLKALGHDINERFVTKFKRIMRGPNFRW